MRIDGLGGAQLNTSAASTASNAGIASDGAQGSWRGEQLQVAKSESSMLADAAEELTFAHQEKAEEKGLKERKVGVGGRVDIPALQQIVAYLDAMGQQGGEAEKLQGLWQSVRDHGAAGARAAAAGGFKDLSQQFLALSYCLRQAEEAGDGDLAEALRDTLDDLADEHGPAIRAGLNTTDAVSAHADALGQSPEALRECYRDTVLGRPTLGETLKSLVARFGGQDLGTSVAFLMRAVGDDMAAQGSSIDKAALQTIVEDLYQLKMLATVLDRAGQMLKALQKTFSTGTATPAALAERMIALVGESWVSADRVTRLTDDLGIRDVEARINFLREFKSMARSIPVKVFPDGDVRDRLLDAVQGALDLAIEQEDA